MLRSRQSERWRVLARVWVVVEGGGGGVETLCDASGMASGDAVSMRDGERDASEVNR